jgi:hypothetical protein
MNLKIQYEFSKEFVLHFGGNTSKILAELDSMGPSAMHTPLATRLLDRFDKKKFSRGTTEAGIWYDGSRTSLELNIFCPDSNLTPTYLLFSCMLYTQKNCSSHG